MEREVHVYSPRIRLKINMSYLYLFRELALVKAVT